MNEEIKFLREYIKDICSYKGLQEELTYDVPLDILKRVCIVLDYLQQENQQLKEENKKLKQPTIFIDTEDMEERYGEQLYQDYLEEQNKDLKQRKEEIIKYIEQHSNNATEYLDVWEVKELLEKLKGNNKED